MQTPTQCRFNCKHLTSLFAGCLLIAAMPLRAETTLCVESTSGLYAAFASLAGTPGPITMRLRSGTYTLGSALHSDLQSAVGPRGRLSIDGGYSAGCTSRSNDVSATTLVSSAGSPDRRVIIEIGDESLLVENLSSSNLDWEIRDTDPNNQSDYGRCRVAGRTATLRRVRLTGTYVLLDLACHGSRIENSYISSRAGTVQDRALTHRIVNPYIVNPDGYGPLNIVFSTIVGGSVFYDACCDVGGDFPPGLATIVNSVFDNDGVELDLAADVSVRHNRFDSTSFTKGTVIANSGNIASPPLLQASGVPQNASPLVNAGTQFADGDLPALDLGANPRFVGVRPDMGAYETAIDNSLYLDVTTTAFTGAGSLSAAVAAANAVNGGQIIRFNIPGSCPRVITLASTLQITDELDVRGATQPGSTANTLRPGHNGRPCVVLVAGSGVTRALEFNSAEAVDSLVVSSLGFSGFSSDGVLIRSGSGHRVEGNRFGGSINGLALADVGTAIRLANSAGAAQIGGSARAQSNLIGNTNFGISLAGAGGNRVIGNAIGDAGFQPLPNNFGIALLSPSNRIEDNLVAHSEFGGVLLDGATVQFNIISGNLIFGGSGNGVSGVSISGAANRNRIGPDNQFTGNDGIGIRVNSGSYNDLSGNTFTSHDGLAIDLAPIGVNANDNDPSVDFITSANRGQNYPVLSLARRREQLPFVFLDIEGALRTTEGVYRIDFYRNTSCDASGHGEGSVLLTSIELDVDCPVLGPDLQCNETFELTVPAGGLEVGNAVTAVATSPGNHTSEFSACRTVSSNVIVLPLIFADGFEP